MMKAISLTEFGAAFTNFSLVDYALMQPRADEVRIKIKAVGFNPVDYKIRRGDFGGELPTILGFDAAGIIDAVGTEVKDFKVGDEVCAYLGGIKSNGAYAEFVCVPAVFVAAKPQQLSFAEAAVIPLAGLTAWYTVVEKLQLKQGDAVLIAGAAGGVGSMAVQLAQHLGAQVVATAGNTASLAYLTEHLQLPAEMIIDYAGLDLGQLTEQALARNQGKAFTASCDYVGGLMKLLCMAVLDFDGKMVTIVEEPNGVNADIWDGRSSPLFKHSVALHFAFLGARALWGSPDTWCVYQQQLVQVLNLFAAGILKVPQLKILTGLSVENVQHAHQLLEKNRVQGKVVMTL